MYKGPDDRVRGMIPVFIWSGYGSIATVLSLLFVITDAEERIERAKSPITRDQAREIIGRSIVEGVIPGILWPALLVVGVIVGILWLPCALWNRFIDYGATTIMHKVNGPPDLRESPVAKAIPSGVDRHRRS